MIASLPDASDQALCPLPLTKPHDMPRKASRPMSVMEDDDDALSQHSKGADADDRDLEYVLYMNPCTRLISLQGSTPKPLQNSRVRVLK